MEESKYVELIVMIVPWLISILTIVVAVIKARRAGKTWDETLTVVINSLKVEEKMHNGSFKPDMIDKAAVVAQAIGVSQEAAKKAQEALKGKEQDIKIGSINGKPIYLGNAIQVGAVVGGLLKKK